MARKATVPGQVASTANNSDGQAPVSLRTHAEQAIRAYLLHLDGHRAAGLHQMVVREVEEPLFRTVLEHTQGNQVRAAEILGINRGTLRRKMEDYGLV